MNGQSQKQRMLDAIEELGGMDVVMERIASCESLTSIAGSLGASPKTLGHYLNKDPHLRRALRLARESAVKVLSKRPCQSVVALRASQRPQRGFRHMAASGLRRVIIQDESAERLDGGVRTTTQRRSWRNCIARTLGTAERFAAVRKRAGWRINLLLPRRWQERLTILR